MLSLRTRMHPLVRCREATIDFGSPATRATDTANTLGARTPGARRDSRGVTARRGDGITCTRCGARSSRDA
jgi:hypothetical protein